MWESMTVLTDHTGILEARGRIQTTFTNGKRDETFWQ